MIQEILTYIIVVFTFAYVFYKLIKLFTKKSSGGSCCSSGGCGCEVKKQFAKKNEGN